MAVQSYFTNYNKLAEPISGNQACGSKVDHFQKTIATAAGDDALSTYLIMKNVPASMTLAELEIEHGSATGASDCDIGFYDSDTGSVLTVSGGTNGREVCASTLDLTTANTKLTPKDGLLNLTHAETLKPIWELLGFAKPSLAKPQYDLVMTIVSDVSAAVDVTFRGVLRNDW